MSDSTLKELWQQVAEKKSCEAKQKELTAQRDTLADCLKKLEKSKLAEQADVDRLEGHSLAAFFYQVIGKMDEKLDKERQEAYAARVKYDAALHDLSSVDADLKQIQNRLARLSDCESQYQAALSEKIKSIKVSAHPAAQQIAESESRIAALKVQKRELLEAINAGKTALHTVNEVLETLHNAEGWSTWDVMGGGLMADLAKYEELDDAQKQIEQLQVELRRFKTELADVEITADLQVTVDSFLKFADFFFDGLFADWAVLDHINQAQSRVENTKGQIKRVLALLKKMREDVDVQIRFDSFKNEHQAVLRAELSYPVLLGDDARGNITRLDNAIDNFADRIADAENALQNLEQQKQAAEVEVAKPFAQEEELAEKSARLAELNALLNIDRDRSSSQDTPEEYKETEAPATRPSVLAALGEKINQSEPVKPFRSYYDKDGDAR